jgi:4-hydroxybenzoate polyprenyltransferase
LVATAAPQSKGRSKLSSVLRLRAWKLAVAGPAAFWYFPIFFVLLSTGAAVSVSGITILMVVMMLSASWGFLINDLFDREWDSRGGRADAEHGHELSRRELTGLVLATAAVSWVLVFLIGGGYVFKAILALDYLISTMYSAPRIKLKHRAFWGFLANSLIERPLPVLVFLAYMDYYTYATVLLPILMELTWSVFKHQAADMREDIEAKVTTFAVYLGERRSTNIVMKVLNPLSVFSLLLLVAMAWFLVPDLRLTFSAAFAICSVAILLAYLGERAGRVTFYVTPTDPPYIIALNLSYRYVVLPAMAYGMLAHHFQYYPLIVLLAITLGFQGLGYVKIASRARGRRPRPSP